ncbi:hypothetical protein [Microbulbifer sp. SSSA005]|uniref:hypothetical protein n=1 Tax=Microbulbifer sp. SSSA005 TaxID=3243378 RepID=UPI0040391A16
MNSVNELPKAKEISLVLKAFESYSRAVNKDSLSTATRDAQIPDAQVFVKEQTGGVIIILPERHSSEDEEVQSGAASIAKYVMAIPKVKIAVEEPVRYNGTLISNVGWGTSIQSKPQSQSIFDFLPDAQGSISHQLYNRQVGMMIISSTRYPAEDMPANPNRYNNPQINATMVKNLRENTKAGDISVFPVGPDHLKRTYDPNTLKVRLGAHGWTELSHN